MTLRRFFVGRAIVFSVLILLGLGVFAYQLYAPADDVDPIVSEETAEAEPAVAVSFAWSFETADSLNLDGNPNTDVYFEVTYSNDAKERLLVDTTAGSCNEVETEEEDVLAGTSVIVCYSAGLGYYFKVIESEEGYHIQRKMFEEASPEYTPPAYEYETIAVFPDVLRSGEEARWVATERYSARVDRVDVVFEHRDYTKYRLVTNGLVREGALNTERGFEEDQDATVYVLNWQAPEGEQMRYVRFTAEPDRIYVLDGNGDPIRGSALILEQ